jgi:hypothetical protein
MGFFLGPVRINSTFRRTSLDFNLLFYVIQMKAVKVVPDQSRETCQEKCKVSDLGSLGKKRADPRPRSCVEIYVC